MLEYGKRRVDGFDYDRIRTWIENFKPPRFGFERRMGLLWTPYMFFSSVGTRRVDENGLPNFYPGKYSGGRTRCICSVVLSGRRKLFGKDDVWMELQFDFSVKTGISEEVDEYIKPFAAIKDWSDRWRCHFETYEEIESCLKGLEDAVRRSGDSYFYFTEAEADENIEIEEKTFLLVNYEKDLASLDDLLNKAEKAEDRQNFPIQEYIGLLQTMISEVKGKIEILCKD